MLINNYILCACRDLQSYFSNIFNIEWSLGHTAMTTQDKTLCRLLPWWCEWFHNYVFFDSHWVVSHQPDQTCSVVVRCGHCGVDSPVMGQTVLPWFGPSVNSIHFWFSHLATSSNYKFTVHLNTGNRPQNWIFSCSSHKVRQMLN